MVPLRIALGVISQMLMAYYFGTARQMDVYFIALALPSIALCLAPAAFGHGVKPALAAAKDSPAVLGRVVSTLLLHALAVSLALAVGGPLVGTRLLSWTTGLAEGELALAGRLAGLMWMVAGLETMNAYLSTLCNISGRRVLPAVTAVFPVLGAIGGAVLLSGRMGVEGLVEGWLVMDLLSLAMLFGALLMGRRTVPMKIRPALGHDKGLHEGLASATLVMMPYAALPAMDAWYLSALPEGGMSYVGYSARAVMVIGLMVTGAVLAGLDTRAGRLARGGGRGMHLSSMRYSLKVALAVLAPVSLFCIFYREEIISLLLKRGAFDAASTGGVAGTLTYYLAGLVAMSLSALVYRAYAARAGHGRACLMTAAMTVFYFITAGALSQRFSFLGIGMAYALYWWVFLAVSALFLSRSLVDRELALFSARTVFNSVTAVAVGYALSVYMPFHPLAVLALSLIFTVSLLLLLNLHELKVREAAA